MQDVAITPLPIDWLGAVIGPDRLSAAGRSLGRLRRFLGDRTVWTVNSTAAGGGVAEMLLGRVRPGDIAVLHDPQVAALASPLRRGDGHNCEAEEPFRHLFAMHR